VVTVSTCWPSTNTERSCPPIGLPPASWRDPVRFAVGASVLLTFVSSESSVCASVISAVVVVSDPATAVSVSGTRNWRLVSPAASCAGTSPVTVTCPSACVSLVPTCWPLSNISTGIPAAVPLSPISTAPDTRSGVPYCPVRLLFDTVIVVFVWSVICAVVVVFAARYRLVSSGMNCTGTVVVLTGRNTGRYVSENSPSLAV